MRAQLLGAGVGMNTAFVRLFLPGNSCAASSSRSWLRLREGDVSVSHASRFKRKRSEASGAVHLSGCQTRACSRKARLISASEALRATPSSA